MLIETNLLSLFVISILILFFLKIIYQFDGKITFKSNLKEIVLSFLFIITPVIIYFFTSNSIYSFLSQIVFIFIITKLIFSSYPMLVNLFSVSYIVFMKILTYVIISWVMSLISHEVMFPISYTIYLADIVFIFILFSTAISIKKFIAKAREYTSLLLVIIILLMVLYYMYLITIFLKKELLLESSIEITLITILVILVYNLVKRLMIIEKKNYKMELYNQELSSNRKNYDTLENSIYEIKKIKHDINHIFLTLLNFLMNKDYDKIHDTLTSQLEIVNNIEKIINTGNQSLNLIFKSYVKAFEKNHIEFITNHFDGEIKIDKIDFYTLLGNLIDNAIENCSSTTNKKILCDIYEENNMLFITCKNTCLNNPLLDNPKFNTTKLNTSNHGIGLKSVEMIVNKNNGMINYDYSINYFMVKIAIVNSNKQ